MVVEGACLLIVLVGRIGRRGAGLVGMLNEVPAAVSTIVGESITERPFTSTGAERVRVNIASCNGSRTGACGFWVKDLEFFSHAAHEPDKLVPGQAIAHDGPL